MLEEEKRDSDDKISYEFVAKGFHSGPIACMDISI